MNNRFRNQPPFSGLVLLLFVMMLPPAPLFAQSKILVRGRISDQLSGRPVAFANISVRNSPNGTSSMEDGSFILELNKKGNNILIISHINYKKQALSLGDRDGEKSLNIALEPKSNQLSDVVVSASLYEQPKLKLTRSAAVISHRQIVDQMNSNLVDMLASTPGFTQVWEYHSPVILRGLNSNRLIIMKDGNRRIGTFPGGYFGQDLNIYDTRKVEIIKGPGSVVYGSGAISGIINVLSNSSFGDGLTRARVLTAYGSNNKEFLEMARISHKAKRYGISVNGKFRKTGNMVYGNGGEASNSAVEDRDIALNTGFKPGKNHQLLFNASYHYGDWGKPRGFNGLYKSFTKINNLEENLHADLAYSWTPGTFLESVHANFYYDDGKRDYQQYRFSEISGKLSSADIVHYKSNYGGGRVFAVLNTWKGNRLSLGTDVYHFVLDNPTTVYDYYYNTEGKIEGYTNAGQEDLGFFLNDEWQLGEKIRLAGGLRYDLARVFEGESAGSERRLENRNAMSGNMGLVFSPTNSSHLSLNLGRAYRMPTAEEMFTKIISCKGIKVGNPELLPEQSWNLDLGWRGQSMDQKLLYDLSLFHIILDDFINEAAVPGDPDVDFTYTNTDASLSGGELSLAYRFTGVFAAANSLYTGLGASFVYGIDLSDNRHSPLFGIPPLQGRMEFQYRGAVNHSWLTGYSLKAECEAAAAQKRIPTPPDRTDGGPWGYQPSRAHAVLNLSAGLNSNALPGHPKLRFIVRNLLNLDYQPYGSYIPAMGRNIKLLLSFDF